MKREAVLIARSEAMPPRRLGAPRAGRRHTATADKENLDPEPDLLMLAKVAFLFIKSLSIFIFTVCCHDSPLGVDIFCSRRHLARPARRTCA